MKILAINGSPKAKNSCTDKILVPLLQGMKSAGANIKTIYLADKKIHHCIGCGACWDKTPGECVIKDEMEAILKQMIEADLIIYGTPLYCYSASGLMKNFMDRSMPLAVPHMVVSDNGVTRPSGRYDTNTKILLVSPCGLPEFDHFSPLIDSFKRIFGDVYLGEILRPAAALMHNDDYQEKYNEYCTNLNKAGNELVVEGMISTETNEKLTKVWISPKEYRERCNKYFAEKISK